MDLFGLNSNFVCKMRITKAIGRYLTMLTIPENCLESSIVMYPISRSESHESQDQ